VIGCNNFVSRKHADDDAGKFILFYFVCFSVRTVGLRRLVTFVDKEVECSINAIQP